MKFALIILFGLSLSLSIDRSFTLTCDDLCRLPDCYCQTQAVPNGLNARKIPQMVSFTFTGAVTETTRERIAEIFTSTYKNPNGCPIAMTFYVLGQYTSFCSVHYLYIRGHEIGVQAFNTSWPDSWSRDKWTKQVSGFRDYLSKEAHIPLDEIVGMRAPMLHPGGDKQFQMLLEEEFKYDSSLKTRSLSQWPQTLYLPWQDCHTPKYCPNQTYPTMWEIPISTLETARQPCTFLDECVTSEALRTHQEILALLIKNLERNYISTRSPLQINMRTDSLSDLATRTALQQFLDYLTDREDTWVVSATDVIEWMQYPVTYDIATTFEPWMCPKRKLNTRCALGKDNRTVIAVLQNIVDPNTLILWQVIILAVTYVIVVIYDRKQTNNTSDEAIDGY